MKNLQLDGVLCPMPGPKNLANYHFMFQASQIVKALEDRGIEVEYMVKEDEGHGFYNEENRFDFYRAMEAFLSKHIK